MNKKYGSRVQFIVIYTIEAHPVGSASPYSGREWTGSASTDKQGNPLTQPETYEQRVSQAAKAIEELGMSVPVLIDEMDNPVWCTYGPAPNIAYFIGTDGIILEKQGWYEPKRMETILAKYLEGNNN